MIWLRVLVVGMIGDKTSPNCPKMTACTRKTGLLAQLQQHPFKTIAFVVDVFQQQNRIIGRDKSCSGQKALQNAQVGADRSAFENIRG